MPDGRSWRLHPRVVQILGAAAVALAASCSGPTTQVIVVVETDIPIPAPLASVRASTGAGSRDFVLDGAGGVPFSFGVVPVGGDAARTLDLVVDGRDAAGLVIVSRSVHTGFRAGQTILLRVRLEMACLGLPACEVGSTCIGGVCTADAIEPVFLPEVIPGLELTDASAVDDGGFDAGTDASDADTAMIDVGPIEIDAGVIDTGVIDTGVDAHAPDVGPADGGPFDAGPPAIPTSCMDVLSRGGASGVHPIDPDGDGGNAPFDVYCENTAEGGGWTLILKVAPTSTTLRYDDTVWTGSVSRAFGDPSTLDSGEALLASYWTLPVSELRFGMTDTAGTRWATATLARTTRLRDAMDIPGAVAIEGLDMPAWSALAGATFTSVCSVSGLGMRMVNASVRIGVLVAGAGPCGSSSTAYAFVGFGASNVSWSGCSAYALTSGGAQPCGGPPSFRFEHPAFGVVMGR